MKKYIITAKEERDYTAASKARMDAEKIAREAGYEPFPFEGERSARKSKLSAVRLIWTTLKNWNRLARSAEPGSIVLIQYPHYPLKTARLIRRAIPLIRKRRKLHFVFLIHDLNSLRGFYGKTAVYSDQQLLKQADTIICHNDRMKAYLIKQGIPEKNLISLRIFDYLTDSEMKEHHLQDGIAIAGNLNPDKCGYIGQLNKLESDHLPVHLYGNGFREENKAENIFYHGAFPAEELPQHLQGAFGLVWDGTTITSCEGQTGAYLRYNNPHKLSLYLASGLPVILWKEAAEAEFVIKNGIGITVNTLDRLEEQIQSIPEETYRQMCEKAQETGKALRSGKYLKAALQMTEQHEKQVTD